MNSKTRPLTSIVILTRNQLEFTRQCVQSLLEHTRPPAELIFVDNGSSDGTVHFLRSLTGATVIVNSFNRGYAAACNQGLAAAKGDFLVLLNNDAVVTKDWLEGLAWHAFQAGPVGLVGPLSNYVGPLQQVSVKFSSLAEMHCFANRLRREKTGLFSESNFISGMCMFIKREVVERIGGLDERFKYGNFEDDDFCLRSALAGFKIRVALDVFVYHYGSRTFAGEKMNYRTQLSENWALFRKKWGLPPDFPSRQRHESLLPYGRSFNPAEHYVPFQTLPEKSTEP